MSEPPRPDRGTMRVSQLLRVVQACDRFEAAWRAGRRPRIEEFLGADPGPGRSALLRELLALELELRRELGERPGPGEYRARFPDQAGAVDAAFAEGPPGPGGPAEPLANRPRADADRGLLLGLLALQNNFVDRDALLAAFTAWVADKARPLGQILRERGDLDADTLALLEALVRKHLDLHAGAPERSLAALSSLGPVRRDLEQIADPELHASLALVATGRGAGVDPDATRTFNVGSVTSPGGRFRILRLHERGGLGEVYVARDEELNREVALKQIQDRHAHDPQSRARFVVEAEITGGLEHPGIIPIYGLGTYDDGRPFYAMRFIRGDSLKQAIKHFHEAEVPGRDSGERSLELRKLLARFLDVCNAVAYAHSRGVLHRDLKPGNILLGPYGETLVVDWGLAKVIGRPEGAGGAEGTLRPASASGSSETQAGSALGTPAFMSPEQAAGRLEELGPASDVYSLGATLYCLLTGRPPFEGSNIPEILRQVRRGEFPKPSARDPAIDPVLEAVCLRAMAPDPGDRYRSPQTLADDIERWLASDYERLEQAHRELQAAHDDLRAVQGSLAESEARYRQLTEGCLDAIVVADRYGRITLFNPAAERTFEYSATEILGRPLVELFASDRREEVTSAPIENFRAGLGRLADPTVEILRRFPPELFASDRREEVTSALIEDFQASSGRLVGRTVELRGCRKSGAPFPLELSLSTIEIAGSVQFMAAIRDQTEQQRMRAKLALSEKVGSVGLLSAGVAHEISNPLASIGNGLAVLERDLAAVLRMINLYEQTGEVLAVAAPDVLQQINDLVEEIDWGRVRENLPRVLDRARGGVQRVTDICLSLRGMARTSRPKMESVLVADLLDSALELIRGKMQLLHIEIQVKLAPDARITCAPSQISQVLLNLLINAVQAVEATGRSDGRWVRLETSCVEDAIVIAVGDNGCGIDPGALPLLFDPFFTTKSVGEGTGLGLSICHSIVTGHGGQIEVESEPGRGTWFRVILPCPRS